MSVEKSGGGEMSARAMAAAYLLALLGLLPLAGAADGASASAAEDEERDDESDSAPFAIVVERGDGRRCGASLVSLRLALTAAACARGQELWALAVGTAPRADGVRRVRRVATAALGDGDAEDVMGTGWSGAVSDLAVVELEKPFGASARVRPILMATAAGECEAAARAAPCHAVRALHPPRAPTAPTVLDATSAHYASKAVQHMRLRIVDALLAPGETCAAAAAHWPAVRDHALCLTGPDFCENDRGIGIVCGGKLCGVLSRSVRASGANSRSGDGDADGEAADVLCGDTHVAQSVSRWRRFLHCAHTLRLCGRGECADLCVERRLFDDNDKPAATRPVHSTVASVEDPERTTATSAIRAAVPTFTLFTNTSAGPPTAKGTRRRNRNRTAPARTTTVTPPTPARGIHRPAFEYEPNRADFKAGEYGDNAVEYGGEEPLATPTRSTVAAHATTGDPWRSTSPAEQRHVAAHAAPEPYLEMETSGVHSSRIASNILYGAIISINVFSRSLYFTLNTF